MPLMESPGRRHGRPFSGFGGPSEGGVRARPYRNIALAQQAPANPNQSGPAPQSAPQPGFLERAMGFAGDASQNGLISAVMNATGPEAAAPGPSQSAPPAGPMEALMTKFGGKGLERNAAMPGIETLGKPGGGLSVLAKIFGFG